MTDAEQTVNFRHVLRADTEGNIGLGFTAADGSVVRLRVPAEDAEQLIESARRYLRGGPHD